ncbi:MAG: AIR synthase [Lachnospiraceae bacterium]|nr:AIR synthase [Lachnospiraceae bacterium]
MMRAPERECSGRMEPGEDLVVAGCIGQQGTRAFVTSLGSQMAEWFSKGWLQDILNSRDADVTAYQEQLQALGVTEAEAAGEGGILTAIWNLSGAYRAGLSFKLRRIPVHQAAIEICERCGCNPYRLWCGNCMVLVAENGGRIVEFFENLGIPAAVIGSVKEGIAREIHHGDETGYLERPREDEVLRILGQEKTEELKAAGILTE